MVPSTNDPAHSKLPTDLTINKFATRLIRRKARELSFCAGFTASDRDDIEQELTLVLLRRLSKFDPAIAHYNAFVTTVIERYAATILARPFAACRSYSRCGQSLNDHIKGSDCGHMELGDTLSTDSLQHRMGRAPRSAQDRTDLAADVAAILQQLPPELADICERLKSASAGEVAAELGIPRTTLCSWLKRLRDRFESHEMREYLNRASSKSGASR